MIRTFIAAILVFMTHAATAEGLDKKKILELMPCKGAALRLCDRSQGITAASLWKCGATLAERQHELVPGCAAVLRRYVHFRKMDE